MSSACRTSAGRAALILPILAAVAIGGAACDDVSSPPVRAPASAPALAAGPGPVRVSDLYPGDVLPPAPDRLAAVYEGDPNHIAAGERYFAWYNCNGCHFSGGGGIGPPLMDEKWTYGDRLDQIYRSIADGRPNGMPTWGGKIPEAQIWEIAAYVKSLSTQAQQRQIADPQTPLDPATVTDPHLEPRFLP